MHYISSIRPFIEKTSSFPFSTFTPTTILGMCNLPTLMLVFCFVASFSPLRTQPFSVRHIDVEQGLPASSVRCITQDQQGFIWVGTLGGGLARFDGNNWQAIPSSATCQSTTINVVHEDAMRRLWIGTEKGLAMLNDQRMPLSLAGFPKNLTSEKIYCIQSQGKTEGWVGTETGLWWYQQGQLFKDTTHGLPAIPIRAFAQTPYGWAAGTPSGFYLRRNNFWKKWSVPGESVQALLWDTVFQRLVIGHTQGVSFYRNDSLLHLPLGETFMENYTTCLTPIKDGSIWIGTLTFPVWLLYEDFTRIGEPPFSLHHSIIQTIFQDKQENIWLGTFEGLDVIQQKPFLHLQYNEWKDSPANHILAMPDQSFWISTDQGAFQWKNGQIISSITEKEGLPEPGVTMIAEAPEQGLWMNVINATPMLYKNGKIMFPLDNMYPFPNIHFIRSFPDDRVVITAAGGLLFMEKKNFTTLTYPKDLPFHVVYDVALGPDGALWISGNGGICRWKKDQPMSFWGPKNGLPEKLVYSIRIDPRGTVWAVNFGGGLIRIDKDSLRVIPQPTHIPFKNWTAMALGKDGKEIWLGGLHGVAHVALDTQTWTWFNEEDGLVGPVVIDGMAIQPNGELLVGTTKGMAWKRAELPNSVYTFASPYLSEVRCDGEQLSQEKWVNKSSIRFSEGNHTLQFQCKTLDLGGSTKHHFSYRILGKSEQWVESKTGEISWIDAPPGIYELQVLVWNDKQKPGKQLNLTLILPPKWYQRSLVKGVFLLLILLAVSLGIWRWVRIREKNIREKGKLQEQLTSLELKTIQQKLNPHFLTNALSNLQGLMLSGEKDKALRYLEDFGQVLHQSLHHQDIWEISLEEELAFFKYYFELENMRLDQAVALEITYGKDIDPEDLKVPPLITQPILENAFKHAFAEGQPGILRLETAWSPEKNLILTITSIGMPWTEKKSTGMGLSLVQQRLEKVYGKGKQPWISWKKMAPNQFKVYLTFPQL